MKKYKATFYEEVKTKQGFKVREIGRLEFFWFNTIQYKYTATAMAFQRAPIAWQNACRCELKEISFI